MSLVANNQYQVYISSNRNVPAEDCSFCLYGLKDEENEKVIQLACSHFFHEACLKRWVRSSSPSRGKCGLCRNEIDRKNLKDLRKVCCMDVDVIRRIMQVGTFTGILFCNFVEVGMVVGTTEYFQGSNPSRHYQRISGCFRASSAKERERCLEEAVIQAKFERSAAMVGFIAYAVIYPLGQIYCALVDSEDEDADPLYLSLPPFMRLGWEVIKGSCRAVYNVSSYAVKALFRGSANGS